MFLTVHATAAVIIAQKVHSPLLAFLLGFVSHYILDAIPHGDDKIFERFRGKTLIKAMTIAAIIDFTISLIWLNFLYQQGAFELNLTILAAVAGSILPDFLNGVFLVTNQTWLRWNHDLNRISHHLIIKKPLPGGVGFFLQLVFFLFLVVLIL